MTWTISDWKTSKGRVLQCYNPLQGHLTFHNRDEKIDENGIIQADGNAFPSKYQVETLLVRQIYFDEINRVDIKAISPTNQMLIGVSSPAMDLQRRHLMRAYQIEPYKNNSSSEITWKFFIGKAPSIYKHLLKFENATYGDLIFLDNFEEGRKSARAIKTFEFFQFVEDYMPMYKYVAKIDTDTFLNVKDFWQDYFNQTVQDLNFAIIAKLCMERFKWPQGGFMAVSWKTMLILNKFYKYVHRMSFAEDLQFGWYLFDAAIEYEFVELSPLTATDFRVPWGLDNIPDNAVRVHELKNEADYILIANCFHSEGTNITFIHSIPESKLH